jgi:short-subunit dehydrogenase
VVTDDVADSASVAEAVARVGQIGGAISYGVSTAVVMSLAEAMRMDLRGTGVEGHLANPGVIRTRMTDKNDVRMPFLMEPEAADEVVRLMRSHRTSRSFPRVFGLLFRVSRFLPDWACIRLFGATG